MNTLRNMAIVVFALNVVFWVAVFGLAFGEVMLETLHPYFK